ncbi:MAG: phosphatidylserine decarboxylase [Hyphomicrobiales bacterium]|nr:phosphatidylserine decarboxylase [Hyphomicrobiales bacterium]
MNIIQDTIRHIMVPIHREGYLFITIFAVVSVILALILEPLGVLGLIATAWCVYFFRNPYRISPDEPSFVLSPADGVVSRIEHAPPPPELEMSEEPLTRISIFLSVFDVHVNRVPVSGKISKLVYHAGKFLNATLDKASEENERQVCMVTTEDGKDIVFVQIAGLIARRIVCDLQEEQKVHTGEVFGIIRFGSRVDVYLPEDITPLVLEGQRMIGGETVLADLKGKHKKRKGIKH